MDWEGGDAGPPVDVSLYCSAALISLAAIISLVHHTSSDTVIFFAVEGNRSNYQYSKVTTFCSLDPQDIYTTAVSNISLFIIATEKSSTLKDGEKEREGILLGRIPSAASPLSCKQLPFLSHRYRSN